MLYPNKIEIIIIVELFFQNWHFNIGCMFAVSPPYNILKYVPWINNTVVQVAWLLVVTLE